MQLPRRHPQARQPRLRFMDPSLAELWTNLSSPQQQTCQQLLSQLLQQILRDLGDASPSEERREDHERPTSA